MRRAIAFCSFTLLCLFGISLLEAAPRSTPRPGRKPVPWMKAPRRAPPKAPPKAAPDGFVGPSNQHCPFSVLWLDAAFRTPSFPGRPWGAIGTGDTFCDGNCDNCSLPCQWTFGLLAMVSVGGDPNDPGNYTPYGVAQNSPVWDPCYSLPIWNQIITELPAVSGWSYAIQAVVWDVSGNQIARSDIRIITIP